MKEQDLSISTEKFRNQQIEDTSQSKKSNGNKKQFELLPHIELVNNHLSFIESLPPINNTTGRNKNCFENQNKIQLNQIY